MAGTSKDYSEIIARNLRKEIKRTYKTQARFADEVGVSEKTVRRWVKDGIDSIYTLTYVAGVLDLDVVDILSEEEDVPFFMSN